jgi:hypothetical protein
MVYLMMVSLACYCGDWQLKALCSIFDPVEKG